MLTDEASTRTTTNPQIAIGWLRLLRAGRAAFDFSKVALAAVGLIVLQVGWAALDRLFPESSAVTPAVHVLTVLPGVASAGEAATLDTLSWQFIRSAGWRLIEPVEVFATPLLSLFARGQTAGWYLHAALAILWVLIVGGIVGGAIARIAVLEVARMEKPGALCDSIRIAVCLAPDRDPALPITVDQPVCPDLWRGWAALPATGGCWVVRGRNTALHPVDTWPRHGLLAVRDGGWLAARARVGGGRGRGSAGRSEPIVQLSQSAAGQVRPLRGGCLADRDTGPGRR